MKKKIILIVLLCVIILAVGGWGMFCVKMYDKQCVWWNLFRQNGYLLTKKQLMCLCAGQVLRLFSLS